MTMVNSRAFAIIVNSPASVRVFPPTFRASGSGGKAGRKGGPREVRRLFQWQKPVSWDVAAVRSRASASGRRWRAEVVTTLPCVRPRSLGFACGPGFSFECLVFAEVGNGDAERVDRNEFVRHLGLEKEDKVRRVK